MTKPGAGLSPDSWPVSRRQPTHEVTGLPWFGPRARAREMLEAYRSSVAVPNKAIAVLRDVLGQHFSALQHIRFVDFHMDGRFRYTIALCWTDSNPVAREMLYRTAAEAVEKSGWYPLPQGERLGSTRVMRRHEGANPSDSLPDLAAARLMELEPAVGPKGGCAIRVYLDTGASVLLDTGLPRRITLRSSDQIALVSHLHRDHVGGIESGMTSGLPAVLSLGTVRLLDAFGRMAAIEQHNPLVLMRPGDHAALGEHLMVDMFAVPHLPGSVGYLLRDDRTALLYTGDVSLKTARHDAIPQLIDLLPSGVSSTVLLDATMAGRTAGATGFDVGDVVAKLQESDVVILGDNADYLLYAYIDLFHQVQNGPSRHQVAFMVTARMRPMFEVLHDAFIRRDVDALDPFLAGQYGKTMSAWAESRWLFWLDSRTPIPGPRRCWLLTHDEWPLPDVPDDALVIGVGRRPLPAAVRTIELDTTPWTLHSGPDALADGVARITSAGARVCLFHNFSWQIREFVTSTGISAVPLEGKILLHNTLRAP